MIPELDAIALLYRTMSLEENLKVFADLMLDSYANWVRLWLKNRDPQMSVVVRYEEILADPVAALTRIAELFQLDSSPETVRAIVEAHSFHRLSKGRHHGKGDSKSFFCKGISVDWMNHFTPELKDLHKQKVGDLLIELVHPLENKPARSGIMEWAEY